MLSVTYLLYLLYLLQKSAGEWSVGEWLEQSVDIFTTGGLGGFHCRYLGRSVTDRHQVVREDNFSASRFARESDSAAGVTHTGLVGMCDSRSGVTVVVGAIRVYVIRFACHVEARELPV